MREVVSTLLREPHECVSEITRIYMRDLYDHVIQIIDFIEIYREMASDLTETYMSSSSNRMNEIMKVLTTISTIFIPLTFLAGGTANARFRARAGVGLPGFLGRLCPPGLDHGCLVPPAQVDVIVDCTLPPPCISFRFLGALQKVIL
jgi:hypothetical protein